MIGIWEQESPEFLIFPSRFVLLSCFTKSPQFAAYLPVRYCTFILQDCGVTLSTAVAYVPSVSGNGFTSLLPLF